MKKILGALIFIVLIIGISIFLLENYLNSNFLRVENNSNENLCVFAYSKKLIDINAGDENVIKFRVEGDGGFEINSCDQIHDLGRFGYFTANARTCHYLSIDTDFRVSYSSGEC